MGALPILFQTGGLSSKLDQIMKAFKNHTQNRIQMIPFIYRDVHVYTVTATGPLRVFQGKFTMELCTGKLFSPRTNVPCQVLKIRYIMVGCLFVSNLYINVLPGVCPS